MPCQHCAPVRKETKCNFRADIHGYDILERNTRANGDSVHLCQKVRPMYGDHGLEVSRGDGAHASPVELCIAGEETGVEGDAARHLGGGSFAVSKSNLGQLADAIRYWNINVAARYLIRRS